MKPAGYTRPNSELGEITVICDRCRREIQGYRDEMATSGFYGVKSGYWHKYARKGEEILCDDCMWADPGYKKDYGDAPRFTRVPRKSKK
jgi:hypothetical protein